MHAFGLKSDILETSPHSEDGLYQPGGVSSHFLAPPNRFNLTKPYGQELCELRKTKLTIL